MVIGTSLRQAYVVELTIKKRRNGKNIKFFDITGEGDVPILGIGSGYHMSLAIAIRTNSGSLLDKKYYFWTNPE